MYTKYYACDCHVSIGKIANNIVTCSTTSTYVTLLIKELPFVHNVLSLSQLCPKTLLMICYRLAPVI